MITSITAAAATAALLAVLAGIVTLLVRASRWPDPSLSKHGLHPDAYRPRTWDEVTSETPLGEAYVMIELPDPEAVVPISQPSDPEPEPEDETVEDVAPISAPPAVEAEPIDELDPRWDWRAFADELEPLPAYHVKTVELVAA